MTWKEELKPLAMIIGGAIIISLFILGLHNIITEGVKEAQKENPCTLACNYLNGTISKYNPRGWWQDEECFCLVKDKMVNLYGN